MELLASNTISSCVHVSLNRNHHEQRPSIKMIIILEKHKITEDVKHKLIRKGLTLTGMSDKDMIFIKLKRHFLS